jgi:hypothetical protein
MRKSLLLASLAPFALTACDNPAGTEGSGSVAIRFATASPGSSASRAAFSLAGSGAEQLTVTGTNGTLTITDVRFILNEFKLERAEGECEGLEGDAEDACEEFEAPPAFIDLPLGAGAAVAATQEVPAGRYEELKFEAEDIDFDDEDDDEKGAAIRALAQTVRAAFPSWPKDASMVVVGTFTPAGGQPVAFTTFFEAEIKVEKEFDPALVIDDANKAVTVEVDPSAWFLSGGRVIDLSAFDFARTGRVVEFEAKMDDGFTKIEFDD